MTELKPCPFCGSEQIVVRRIKDAWSCGCTTTDCMCQWWYLRQYKGKEFAMEAWNKRGQKYSWHSEDPSPEHTKEYLTRDKAGLMQTRLWHPSKGWGKPSSREQHDVVEWTEVPE